MDRRKARLKTSLENRGSGDCGSSSTTKIGSGIAELVLEGSKLTASVMLTNWLADVSPAVVSLGNSSVCRFTKFHSARDNYSRTEPKNSNKNSNNPTFSSPYARSLLVPLVLGHWICQQRMIIVRFETRLT
jgi:hypothetical protein